MKAEQDLGAVVRHFQVSGEFLGATQFGAGHINDSYCAAFQKNGRAIRFMLQRVNTHVFTNPAALMLNIARVTEHIAGLLWETADAERRALRFVPACNGALFYVDAAGLCWRMMHYIEGTDVVQTIDTPEQAYRIAQAFGKFQEQLAGLPAPRLVDTLPNFHNTPKRFADLERAIAEDAAGRAALVQEEIDFALTRRAVASQLVDAGLPERTTHNDAKSNNVLLDDATGEAICVVDLDTVMPGLSVYDFGDMVRSMTSPAAEDEQDLTQVTMRFRIFEALARGFVDAGREFLTRDEKRLLPAAGKVITFENGLRFLADYLNGDTYYKVHREGQNLDRCRTQFKLVRSIEEQEPEMRRLLDGLL